MADRQEVPQVRYNTDITDEYFHKYRTDEFKQLWHHQYIPRSLLYPNDLQMITKTLDGAKNGSIAGLGVGFVMANDAMKSRFDPLKETVPVVLENFFKHFTPWLLAGTMYGFGTSAVANYRHKEDYVNHIFGGLAGGSVFGMWYKNTRMGFWCMLGGGLAGGVFKCLRENNLDSVPRPRIRVFNMYRRNWFTEPIDPKGTDDDEYKYYKP